jgi:hypothetical protein
VQLRPQIRLRHEVDRLGRAPGEHDFAALARVEQAGDRIARGLVLGRGALGERVHPAMDVGVGLAIVAINRLDHRLGLLRGRGIVEIHQRVPANRLLQGRKIGPQALDIERPGLRRGVGR